MSTIVAAGSVSEFFLEIVGDAIKARKLETSDGAQTYLVSLLSDYAKPDERAEEPLERPLAFLLDEALHTVEAGARFDRLRALGDGVLYACGFFGEHFEARGVDRHDGVRRGQLDAPAAQRGRLRQVLRHLRRAVREVRRLRRRPDRRGRRDGGP
jgi:hypothetical protein